MAEGTVVCLPYRSRWKNRMHIFGYGFSMEYELKLFNQHRPVEWRLTLMINVVYRTQDHF
ncbi:hypothetical protein DK869_03720 [Commensalibacter melissae]|uniref:Uncharacterized protein n=2 Tax=Commensalibacter melissae TaxID=2070537 RepID=A0A318NC88_9PROT|nr:hypothetical protein DK869_03720 [Commensalibacter melissae]